MGARGLPPGPPHPSSGPPAPPSTLSQLQNWGLGTFFSDQATFSLCLCRTAKGVQLLFHVYPMFMVLQMTVSQCSLAAYFGSLVQLLPRVKCKEEIAALLYFRLEDRLTRRKRQEAYNDVQKACYTLFLSVSMAKECECVTVA